MGEHGSFGHAGCAARVLEQHYIVRCDADGGCFGRAGRQQIFVAEDARSVGHIHHQPARSHLFFHQPVERKAQGIWYVGDDHPLDGCLALYRLQAAVKAAEHYNRLSAAVGQLVLDLPRGISGVRIHHHTACLQNAIEGDDLLGDVGQHHRDPVGPASLPYFAGRRQSDPWPRPVCCSSFWTGWRYPMADT